MLPSPDFWLVPVLDSDEHCGEHCVVIARALAEVAAGSDGAIRAGVLRGFSSITTLDGDEATVAALYNMTQVPQLLLWPPGTGPRFLQPPLRLPPQVAASLLTAGSKRVYETLKALIPSVLAPPLRRASARALFAEPRAGLPRVVLAHAKAEPSAPFKRLALDFAGRAVFALAPADDAHVLAALGLASAADAPALFVSPGGAKDAPPPAPAAPARAPKKKGKKGDAAAADEAPSPAAAAADDYPAPLAWAHWARYPKGAHFSLPMLRAWLDATLPRAPLPALRSAADFDALCARGAASICFVAVLPADAPRAAAARAALQAVADSHLWLTADLDSVQSREGFTARRAALAFATVDGAAQGAWASALRVAAPGLVAINARKRLVAPLAASFSEANVRDFAASVMFQKPAQLDVGEALRAQVRPPVDVRLERLDTLPALADEPPAPHARADAEAPVAAAPGERAEMMLTVDMVEPQVAAA